MAEGGTDRSMSETEMVPGHSSLYSRHSLNYVESVSVETSTIMTRLGYGEEIRRWRIEKYRENDRLCNSGIRGFTRITSGSKAEGLTCRLESDSDYLAVMNNILCFETGINLHTIPDNIEVYRMDTCIYPGYCKLFRERQTPSYCKEIDNALCDNGKGDVLLGSGLLLDDVSTLKIIYVADDGGILQHERAGPSIPMTMCSVLHTDFVSALRCHCPASSKDGLPDTVIGHHQT
ncbi:hypothetical protein DPMN_149693 [Dreissena polymorpha]|uniref:Uncharacterized protein n=1 Tax=Dreissena polymorpha TaxID=45954 RepID=A0A9D4FDZ9_DREPO|nr:hypothetical protein DPMN_149693 [Dreissena polymorpha]